MSTFITLAIIFAHIGIIIFILNVERKFRNLEFELELMTRFTADVNANIAKLILKIDSISEKLKDN